MKSRNLSRGADSKQMVRETTQSAIERRGLSLAFDACSNPEFLKEGAAIEDFTMAARIVVGAESDRVIALMRECYSPYNRNHSKLIGHRYPLCRIDQVRNAYDKDKLYE